MSDSIQCCDIITEVVLVTLVRAKMKKTTTTTSTTTTKSNTGS